MIIIERRSRWDGSRDPEAGRARAQTATRGCPAARRLLRDPRLARFASDGGRDALVPSARLARLADEVSGPERRCPGATDDELVGLLRAWAAIESWAAAARLGVIAELIRHEDAPRNGGYHGDLPDEWSPSLRHELAAALACSAQSAETTAWLAWEQQARLPGVGALLADGTLTFAKARAVIDTFKYLADGDAARAEALILDQLAGKTYTQVAAAGRAGRPDRRPGTRRATAGAGPAEGRAGHPVPRDVRDGGPFWSRPAAGRSPGRDGQRQRAGAAVRGIRRIRRHPDGRAAGLCLP